MGGSYHPEYVGLLPPGMYGHETEGVGLLLELAFVVERYIKKVSEIWLWREHLEYLGGC